MLPEAFVALRNRCGAFRVSVGTEIETEVQQLMHLGRTTVSEVLLVEALVLSREDHAKAVADIGRHVKAMGALPGKDAILPSHIHPFIWKCCDRATGGQSLV